MDYSPESMLEVVKSILYAPQDNMNHGCDFSHCLRAYSRLELGIVEVWSLGDGI